MSENHYLPLSKKQLNAYPHSTGSPLLELNQNITNNATLPFTSSFKRQTYLQKKALFNKIQKGQLQHCCIDIVNRKNNSVLIERSKFSQTSKVSNIQLLKKQIEYLQEDNLKWDKFPHREADFEPKPAENQCDSRSSLTLQLQPIQKVNQNHNNSSLLKHFYNTFNNNFFVSPIPLRNSSLERRAKSYFSTNKKKSLKSTISIEPKTPILKENVFCRTIHSSSVQGNSCRKYFHVNRTHKNSAYTQNSSFLLQKRKKISLGSAIQLQTL